mmetsp:Transcript_2605/g.2874  ORF Transcript_2605/g.2874 Transcript_2605/m.2874 type:complete len:156 (+) Transcript_2605:114-581(+)
MGGGGASTRVYVGSISDRVTERDLQEVFGKYGTLLDIWVARRPPGFAFIEFEDARDASDAIRGEHRNPDGWKVELSNRGPGGKGGGKGRDRDGPPPRRSPSPSYRRRSPPPMRRSPDYGRGRSPDYGRGRSPDHRDDDRRRGRSPSRSRSRSPRR